MINKSLDFEFEFKMSADAAEGTVEGYGSMFNLMDRGGDIVLPGAYKKSLAEWRKMKQLPSMLWSHNTDQPIGVWTDMEEDDKGLKIKGELILDVPQAKVVHALIKKKAVRGLSIGYRSKNSDFDRTTGARLLKEVELFEVSLVSIPMLKEAQVTGVKGEFDAPAWEKIFRDGGLSIREAKLATSLVRKNALRDGEDIDGKEALRDGLRDLLLNTRLAAMALR